MRRFTLIFAASCHAAAKIFAIFTPLIRFTDYADIIDIDADVSFSPPRHFRAASGCCAARARCACAVTHAMFIMAYNHGQ